ncbi:MAG: hypothetical protein JWR26_3173 [Pedosphaera sp.]|nr:hypothetical protein [Pedosphaera sp.]
MVAGILIPANAANWYVDNAAHGTKNGTSWTNAWSDFSSVVWGTSGVKAGDTLYISGGSTSKTYTNVWSVGASGTASSPIRIALDATNTNHNGTVIFDYNYAGDQASFNGITCFQNYVTFDGNVGGACKLVVSNLRNIINRNSAIGIYSETSTGIVIDHFASTNCNNPIRVTSSGSFRISNCNLRQVRGDAAIAVAGSTGGWDANLIYSNVLEALYNTAVPAGKTTLYVGPDGVQCSSGISMYGNIVMETPTSVYTSDQHPDMIQATGDYLKIYGNEFINVGDSVFNFDAYDNANPHDVWIFNNVFRITTALDEYPEYFRLYSENPVSSIVNFKILNNTFVDNNTGYRVIRFDTFVGNPTASGNEIKNNIFYNCGGGGGTLIFIDNSTAFTANSFSFDANIYYHSTATPYISFRGTNFTAANWVSTHEPNGKTNAPKFVSYAALAATGNDFHLQSSDTAAKDKGLSFSNYFAFDRDRVSRPQGTAWDIGAYEYLLAAPPALSIRTGSGKIILSWPTNQTGFVVESKSGITSTNWTTVTNVPVLTNGLFTFTNTMTGGNKFYRLRGP